MLLIIEKYPELSLLPQFSWGIIIVATFITAVSLLICKTNPVLCSCFNLLLYAIFLFEFLFIGKFKLAILIDILLLVVFSVIYISKKRSYQ